MRVVTEYYDDWGDEPESKRWGEKVKHILDDNEIPYEVTHHPDVWEEAKILVHPANYKVAMELLKRK